MLLDPQTTNQVDGNEFRAMKSSLKQKIALMLLEVLKRKGLKCEFDRESPPVLPADFQEAQDFLGRLGYEFVTRRRLQDAPKATSKEIYLKMIRGIMDEPLETENVIWVRMDVDTAMKSLALGFLPESAESDS